MAQTAISVSSSNSPSLSPFMTLDYFSFAENISPALEVKAFCNSRRGSYLYLLVVTC
jgi:hypothetical protein